MALHLAAVSCQLLEQAAAALLFKAPPKEAEGCLKNAMPDLWQASPDARFSAYSADMSSVFLLPCSQPAPQQHPPATAATTAASPPKAPLGKTGAWFKKAFAAGKTGGGKAGGWATNLKQSVSRMSAGSVASDDSDATASGHVTPQTGARPAHCLLQHRQ